jgi:uncharacterized protein (TIGR02996 family)
VFTLVITGPSSSRLVFDEREVTIGRVEGNHVVLADANVSRRHARLVLRDGKYILVDLKSTNGTYVNGRKLTSPLVVKENDRIYIGDYTLAIEDDESESEQTAERPLAPFLPRDATEAGLLRAIGAADAASREVYADYLEDHGHAAQAEFLRTQQRLYDLAPSDPAFEATSERLRELSTTIEFQWRVRVARPAIERCPSGPKFDFKCPKDWGSLAPTEREDRRFCTECKKHVHYCLTVPEARNHAARGECVALDLRAVRWQEDVEPPYGLHRCTSCRSDVGTAARECPRCGEPLPPRRYAVVGMMA